MLGILGKNHEKKNDHIGTDLLCWPCGPRLTPFTEADGVTDVPRQELSAQVPADKEIIFHQTMAEGKYH